MRYGVGVIGIGFGQAVHVPAFRGDLRCEVVALGASTKERAAAAAQTCGVPNSHGDWRELIADPAVHIVSLAVPAGLQHQIARETLALGKPVFLEKPAAATAEQARELAAIANENNTRCLVDFEFIETPGWPRLKTAIDDANFGRLNLVNVDWHVCSYAFKNRSFDSWKLRPSAGGGVLNLFGTHTFHYLEWLFGPIGKLHAHLPKLRAAPDDVEALALIKIEFESGQQGCVSLSNASFMGNGHRLELYGDEGSARLENTTTDYIRGFTLEIGDMDSGQRRKFDCPANDDPEADGRIAPVSRMVKRFLNSLDGGPVDYPTASDGARVQHLVDLARASSREGVWLSAS